MRYRPSTTIKPATNPQGLDHPTSNTDPKTVPSVSIVGIAIAEPVAERVAEISNVPT